MILIVGGTGTLGRLVARELLQAGEAVRVMTHPMIVPRLASRLIRPLHPGAAQMLQMASSTETADQRFDARDLEQRFSTRMTRLADWVRTHAS